MKPKKYEWNECFSPNAMGVINNMAIRLTGKPVHEEPITKYVKQVIYNDPVTVVYWSDGTKTVVRCQHGDMFNPLIGFLMAALKYSCGNKGNYNELLKKFVPGYGVAKDDGNADNQ